jgi:hypothetical protein
VIRIVVRTDHADMAVVGSDVLSKWKTFDVELPELEQYLRADIGKYSQRQVSGVELLEKEGG